MWESLYKNLFPVSQTREGKNVFSPCSEKQKPGSDCVPTAAASRARACGQLQPPERPLAQPSWNSPFFHSPSHQDLLAQLYQTETGQEVTQRAGCVVFIRPLWPSLQNVEKLSLFSPLSSRLFSQISCFQFYGLVFVTDLISFEEWILQGTVAGREHVLKPHRK